MVNESKLTDHKELEAWKESMNLTVMIYTLVEQFPAKELYGLRSQMTRAAVSIPSNIAEGAARRSSKDFMRFLSHSRGSIAELETQLLIAQKLKFAKIEDTKSVLSKLSSVARLTTALYQSIERKLADRPFTSHHSPFTADEHA
jgi:four helix bundle protein